MLPSLSRSSPSRRTTPFDPPPTTVSSPTSAVFDEPPLMESQATPGTFALPSLREIDTELSKVTKQSASSKASYRAKLGKMTVELKEAHTTVEILQLELNAAKSKEAIAQRAMDDAKGKRQTDSIRLQVRKAHLKLVQQCLEVSSSEGSFLSELASQKGSFVSIVPAYQKQTVEELEFIGQRLDGIQNLFSQAHTAAQSSDLETRDQAQIMVLDAMSKYELFLRYGQI